MVTELALSRYREFSQKFKQSDISKFISVPEKSVFVIVCIKVMEYEKEIIPTFIASNVIFEFVFYYSHLYNASFSNVIIM